jgi:hypothetical protein
MYIHKIVIYDDGSSDTKTLEILDKYKNNEKYEIKMNSSNVGCKQSYLDLLRYISIKLKT